MIAAPGPARRGSRPRPPGHAGNRGSARCHWRRTPRARRPGCGTTRRPGPSPSDRPPVPAAVADDHPSRWLRGTMSDMGPRRLPGPVSQHVRVAIEDQVHQRGAVGRGHRPQVGGKAGHVGEHVHRPEPAREFARRNHAPDVPRRLVDQHPVPGPGGAARPPVRPGRAGAVAVGPHLAHLDLGERGAPALWVIGHALIFGPPPPAARADRRAKAGQPQHNRSGWRGFRTDDGELRPGRGALPARGTAADRSPDLMLGGY